MADIIDRAQAIETEILAREIGRARASLTAGPGATFCEHCEEPIPTARRMAQPGCRLCVRCQAEFERG